MLPKLLTRYTALIEDGLRQALAGESLLFSALRYHVGLEDEQGKPCRALGKLLRPSLLLFTTEQLGGDPPRALPAAIGLELVHNFSLIHDDIQDHDRLRRGRPTVWSRYGIAQAINAGDLMHSLAVGQAARVDKQAVAILVAATVEMIEGQGLDLAFEEEQVSEDAYLGMIDKKTGALIRCALQLGGYLAGVTPRVGEELIGLGKNLGRAFQIRDDLLGIWGNGSETGKPEGSDIRRRKKSFPMAVALARANDSQQQVLQELYSQDEVPERDVKRVITMMEQLDVRRSGEDAVSHYLEQAKEHVRTILFSPDGKKEMNELIDYLARRKK